MPDCTIYEYLWENNKENLNDVALIYFGKKITFGELFELIDSLAAAFIGIGLKKGDVCTVVTLSCINSVAVFYALNKIGAVSNYINVLTSEEEMETYLSDANSEYVVTMDLFVQKVLEAGSRCNVKHVISYTLADYMPFPAACAYKVQFSQKSYSVRDERIISWNIFLKQGQGIELKEPEHDGNRVSVWAHTGGTTGFPKTVLHKDNSYNAVVLQYMNSMEHKRGEVFLNIIVPFVVYGMLTCMHMPLCLGLTVAIVPKFEAKDWSKYLKWYHPNHIAGIPSYFSPMLCDENLKSTDLSSIITLAAGGDGMNEQLETELNDFLKQHGSNAQLIKGYGMTEICSSAVTTFGNYSKLCSVGIPLVKNSICIYDNDRKCECKYGHVGEVWLLSPSLMVGYKDNEEETDSLIIADDQDNKWIHTEDLGYVDEQGFLFLLGRMKRVMFVGPEGLAYKVFPKQIEDEIIKVPEVSEVCVVSGHDGKGFAPKAFVVLKSEFANQTDQMTLKLKNECEKNLPDYLLPYEYEYLDSLPLTSIGKVDYGQLEARALH